MLRPTVGHRRTLVALVVLVLLALAGSLVFAATVARVQARQLIPGVQEQVISIPTARLNLLKNTKQMANMEALRNTYFVREGKTYIRAGEESFELLPLSKMAYNPTAAQIQPTQVLSPAITKYREYILKHPGVSIAVIPDVVDHRPSQTPIKNQNPRGTCVCFASMAGLEMAYGGGTLDLSENYANYLYMKAESRVCKDDGLQTHMSADYLTNHGVATESICPYQTSFPAFCNNGADPAPAQRAAADATHPYRIKTYQKIWRKDDLAADSGAWINNPRYLEAILAGGKDIIFGTHVAGWTSPYTGVLDVKLTASGDPLPSVGGHAMLIVGYNRPGEYFIVKNSWGTARGQAGYLYLSYDYIRTYAKYGYVINEVYPIPLTAVRPALRAVPRRAP